MNKIISAGGIITRTKEGELQILVIKREQGKFSFPKGHVEENETVEEAATREVLEETGFQAKIIGRSNTVSRTSHDSDYTECEKIIHYFRMEIDPGSIQFPHDQECSWQNVGYLKGQLLFKEEKVLLQGVL
ncbi:MAG: NUDIX domain-containing protein [Candidatus Berkelbacteria bacterium]|nr:NUDIX domain-containing protein [Candidatus Berkelbacteria bacterium]